MMTPDKRTIFKVALYGFANKLKLLSYLSAHLVNRLLRENRKSIQIVLSGKKTSKKCSPPDFELYPSELAIKMFPHMV